MLDVYKEECQYSLRNLDHVPIYVNLTTLGGVSKAWIEYDSKRHANPGYVMVVQNRTFNKPVECDTVQEAMSHTEYDTQTQFFYLSGYDQTPTPVDADTIKNIPHPGHRLSASIVIHSKPPEASVFLWDETLKTAEDIQQLPSLPRIEASKFECSACGAKSNIWMNLSDGFIGCGRRQYGMVGGCFQGEKEGAAITHNAAHPERSLAVKLGSIRKGRAEVFSYLQGDMVKHPNLRRDLLAFGLDPLLMDETEATLDAITLEKNKNLAIEGSRKLDKRLYGLGHVGLKNLGNTCYMNSMLQLLGRVPSIRDMYGKRASEFIGTSEKPMDDWKAQFAKIVSALNVDEQLLLERTETRKRWAEDRQRLGIADVEEADYVCPTLFRRLVGKRNREFQSARQQDADEFYRFWLSEMSKEELPNPSTEKLFSFEVLEKRPGGGGFGKSVSTALTVPVPPGSEQVSLNDCISLWRSDDQMISTFPQVLVVQVQRFLINEDQTIKKDPTLITAPMELDLSYLKAPGTTTIISGPPEPLVENLQGMGFVKQDIEIAYCLCSSDDVMGVLDVLTSGALDDVRPLVVELVNCGFEIQDAVLASQNTQSLEAAREWLASRRVPMDALSTLQGMYRIVGYVVHIGASPNSGHYVAHIPCSDDTSILLDDKDIGITACMPSPGYMYIYQHI